jgi:hypothetical protein
VEEEVAVLEPVAATVMVMLVVTVLVMAAVTAAAMVTVLLPGRMTPMAATVAAAVTPSAPVAGQRLRHRGANIAPRLLPGGSPARGLAMRIRRVG